MSWLGVTVITTLTIFVCGLLLRWSSIPERLGLRRVRTPHDEQVHDAANREQVALSGLELVQRRSARDISKVVSAQRSEERSSELRETSEKLRQSIEKKIAGQDTLDAFVRGKRDT